MADIHGANLVRYTAIKAARSKLLQRSLDTSAPGCLDAIIDEVRVALPLVQSRESAFLDTDSLSDDDAALLGRVVGEVAAARIFSALLAGGGAVTQIKNAEGAAVVYASGKTGAVNDPVSDALLLLNGISFIAARLRQAQSLVSRLGATTSRPRDNMRLLTSGVSSECAPAWGGGFDWLNFADYPLSGGVTQWAAGCAPGIPSEICL